MFIQVIRGHVVDPEGMRNAFDRWRAEVEPGAAGWLGSTSGVTADGTFITVVRFDSEASARHNNDRSEQIQWWTDTSKLFDGDVTFRDYTETITWLAGGSDDAGFVQVVQGRVRDAERMRALMDVSAAPMRDWRPDVIGSTTGLSADGSFTQTVYFTSERAARDGERRDPPESARALLAEEQSLLEDLSYLDLRDPWIISPR